jgi:hypothetical protein
LLNFYEGHKVYLNGEYPAIYLNGKSVHIHRLEWTKHYGAIPKNYIVHHKDENKFNWNIDNLELITRSEHIKKHQHNLHNENTRKFGEISRHHKLTQSDVNFIKSVYVKYDKNYGGRALSKMFGVTEACISSIVLNKNWSDETC